MLNAKIQAGFQVVSILCLNNSLLHIGIIVEVAVLAAIDSHKAAVVIAFQAIICRVPGIGEAKCIAGKLIIRINSLVILLKPDALHILPFLNFCCCKACSIGKVTVILKGFLVIHTGRPFDHPVLAVLCFIICQRLSDSGLFHSKNIFQCPDRGLYIIGL